MSTRATTSAARALLPLLVAAALATSGWPAGAVDSEALELSISWRGPLVQRVDQAGLRLCRVALLELGLGAGALTAGLIAGGTTGTLDWGGHGLGRDVEVFGRAGVPTASASTVLVGLGLGVAVSAGMGALSTLVARAFLHSAALQFRDRGSVLQACWERTVASLAVGIFSTAVMVTVGIVGVARAWGIPAYMLVGAAGSGAVLMPALLSKQVYREARVQVAAGGVAVQW